LKTGKITKPLTTADGKAQQRYWLNHTEALKNPNKFEVPLLAILRGLADYADTHESKYGDSIGKDYCTGEQWLDALRGVKGFLNCELNRLDGGILDGAIRELATVAGLDPDLNK
jgi:hypothetical protein